MAADQSHPHEEVVVDERRPWPGLVPFREAHRHFFFGRGHEQEELLRSIRRGINMLLFGESGLGKTSLLQAGLFPRLITRKRWRLPIRSSSCSTVQSTMRGSMPPGASSRRRRCGNTSTAASSRWSTAAASPSSR
jgi:hypothetical protein